MAAASIGLLVALDIASSVLALVVAAFFLRSARRAPGRGFGLLAGAFLATSAGYPLVAISAYDVLPVRAAGDAARASLLLLGGGLLALHYVGRRAGWPIAAVTRAAWAAAAGTLVFAASYLALPGAMPAPASLLAPFRIVECILLIVTALLVTLEVRARTLDEFRVPAAFLCFAFSRYTVALLQLHGEPTVTLLTDAWRLAGLLLLLSVVRRGW